MMWTTNAQGQRRRIFCKACLFQGRDWLTPEPCEHIRLAEGEHAEIETVQKELQSLGLQDSGDPK